MFIKQIKGTYGTLENEQLDFDNGLNIISKDNEWGKTTLISFIKTMFYGLNLSKRDKKDSLSEKTKYTSSGFFTGEMTISVDDEDVIVSRERNGKSQSFNSYYKETGLKTAYSSSNFGPLLLSVSEEAYANSALIEFDNRLISNSKELESLIISMTTTGDVDSNFEKAYEILKKSKSELEKASGTKALKEKELEVVDLNIRKIDYIKNEVSKLEAKRKELDAELNAKKEEYETKFREGTILKIKEQERDKIVEAQSNAVLQNLSKEYHDERDLQMVSDAYATYKEAHELSEKYRLDLQAEQEKNQDFRDEILEKKDKFYSRFRLRPVSFIMTLIFAGLAVYIHTRVFTVEMFTEKLAGFSLVDEEILTQFMEYVTTNFDFSNVQFYGTIALAIFALLSLFSSFKRRSYFGDFNDEFDETLIELDDNELFISKNYEKYSERTKDKLVDLKKACQRVGIVDTHDVESIQKSISYLYDVNKRYQAAYQHKSTAQPTTNAYKTEKIAQINNEIAMAQAEYNQIAAHHKSISNDIVRFNSKADEIPPMRELKTKQDLLTNELSSMYSKINALSIALVGLDEANQNLTTKFSPKISETASKYLSFLTDNRYDTIILRKDLEALCKTPETFNLMDKLKLSSGTKEQLYFALRLAICEVLIDKKVPIILDDPFVFYDETRMKKAVDLLLEIAKERQVLLFTCHNRELNYINNM